MYINNLTKMTNFRSIVKFSCSFSVNIMLYTQPNFSCYCTKVFQWQFFSFFILFFVIFCSCWASLCLSPLLLCIAFGACLCFWTAWQPRKQKKKDPEKAAIVKMNRNFVYTWNKWQFTQSNTVTSTRKSKNKKKINKQHL